MKLPHRKAPEGESRWELFSHGADVGIRGLGPTRQEAFEQAGLALTAVITSPKSVRPLHAIQIQCRGENLPFLFVNWIDALVYEMATRQMLFGKFEVTLDGLELRAQAWGEPVDVARHQPAAEVKGATLTELRVHQTGEGYWLAQCVVDV